MNAVRFLVPPSFLTRYSVPYSLPILAFHTLTIPILLPLYEIDRYAASRMGMGERRGVNVSGEETNPQIINLRCYTVVAGEPDVVTR